MPAAALTALVVSSDDAQVRRIGELHEDEWPARGGMGTGGEGRTCRLDVGLEAADLDKMSKLGLHDIPATHHLP